MIQESFGRVFNLSGEIVADGSCLIDVDRGVVTLRPIMDAPLLTRQHGELRLELDDGGEFTLRDQVIRFRLNVPGAGPGPAYRLFIAGPSLRAAEGG